MMQPDRLPQPPMRSPGIMNQNIAPMRPPAAHLTPTGPFRPGMAPPSRQPFPGGAPMGGPPRGPPVAANSQMPYSNQMANLSLGPAQVPFAKGVSGPSPMTNGHSIAPNQPESHMNLSANLIQHPGPGAPNINQALGQQPPHNLALHNDRMQSQPQHMMQSQLQPQMQSQSQPQMQSQSQPQMQSQSQTHMQPQLQAQPQMQSHLGPEISSFHGASPHHAQPSPSQPQSMSHHEGHLPRPVMPNMTSGPPGMMAHMTQPHVPGMPQAHGMVQPPMPHPTQIPGITNSAGMVNNQYLQASGHGMQPNMGMSQGPPMPPSQYGGSPAAGPPGPIPQQGMQPPGPLPQQGMQNRYPSASAPGSAMGYPAPGFQSAPGQYGGSPPSQARRLNPDDMPSPLQVMENNVLERKGDFITNEKGSVPPLVTTAFTVRDGGNASPRYIRSTLYSVPNTPDMMKQAAVPFGLVISPMAEVVGEEAPPYIGTSLENGPVRCNRCKAYMSPLMQFMDGGRKYQCLLCKASNEVPKEYFCHMDGQGARADKYQRPELCLGTYEYLATTEYCREGKEPLEPAFIFVIEMSQLMMQRGVIQFLCEQMRSILSHLPKDMQAGVQSAKSVVKVGFITYDSSVHFYRLDGPCPEMCILCDHDELFVPVPNGILQDAEDAAATIEKLMELIPINFQHTRETSGAFAGAVQAGMMALKASGRAGKLFVFHSSLPQLEGPSKLKNREDRKLLGTEKEKVILTSQNQFYGTLGQDLVSVGCSVDLFLFNDAYVDLATIGQVSRMTGGQCYKYSHFQANRDGQRLLENLQRNVGRSIAFDTLLRVRTSTGIRACEFFGHFFMSNTQDVEMASIDSSKAIAVEVKHDDKLTEEDGVYIQVALLYTSVGGQRRLRVINLALSVCSQYADLYKNCELDTLINFLGKQSMSRLLETSAKMVKENLIARSATILACYRKNCAQASSAGQLILPEMMKLLPLYVNCLSKCDAMSGGQDLTCDDRSHQMLLMNTMRVEASVPYFYPRLLPLSDVDPQGVGLPPMMRCLYEKLRTDAAYVLENGVQMFIWVGSAAPAGWLMDVFGVSAPHQLDPTLTELPELDNPTSHRVSDIIDCIRQERDEHIKLYVVQQQGKHELIVRNYLVEDKNSYGAPSYVDFLCHVHKEIRALLS